MELVEKSVDASQRLFDLVETGGVGAAHMPRPARTEGIAGNDCDSRLMQQPRREVVRGESRRGD